MRRTALSLVLLAAATVAAGCGSGGGKSSGPVITGPGITATKPPWKPEYTHLRERMRRFGVPPPGTERYHHHAQLHIYDDGLLVDVPTHIGLAPGVTAALHTHAPGGVIHIEASKPFVATLGDFFAIWGVAFGPDQVGDLKASGDEQIHVLVNGKPIANPIDYRIREGDNIVVARGKPDSFPKRPSVILLRQVQSGRGGSCTEQKGKKAKKKKSCTAG